MVDSVISLTAEDGDELGPGLEEAAPLADRLEGAVEPDRSSAVTVPQETPVLRSDPAQG